MMLAYRHSLKEEPVAARLFSDTQILFLLWVMMRSTIVRILKTGSVALFLFAAQHAEPTRSAKSAGDACSFGLGIYRFRTERCWVKGSRVLEV